MRFRPFTHLGSAASRSSWYFTRATCAEPSLSRALSVAAAVTVVTALIDPGRSRLRAVRRRAVQRHRPTARAYAATAGFRYLTHRAGARASERGGASAGRRAWEEVRRGAG